MARQRRSSAYRLVFPSQVPPWPRPPPPCLILAVLYPEKRLLEVTEMKEEKRRLTDQMDTVHQQYGKLNSQLQAMQKLFNDFQVAPLINKLSGHH